MLSSFGGTTERGIWGASTLKRFAGFVLVALCAFPVSVSAQGQNLPWEEYDRLINSGRTISALSIDSVFGEQLDLYSGQVSFSTTDVSIPGNNNLPVAMTRKFVVANREGYNANELPFADWDVDIPNVSAVFASAGHDSRCTQATPPVVLGRIPPDEYWAGTHASMPGGGEMLRANVDRPKPSTGGPYLWVTQGDTYFSCLTAIKNGSGQGFLAFANDGTKYWFDHMAQYVEPDYTSVVLNASPHSVTIQRRKNVLYATRIEDRFGNWVAYTYSNASNQPMRVTQIASSDGRTISFGYNSNGFISSVTDGVRAWVYQYQTYTEAGGQVTKYSLSRVTQPDGSNWQMSFSGLASAKIQYSSGDPRRCFSLDSAISGDYSGTITHPSGAVGTFTVGPLRFGRTRVPAVCRNYTQHLNPGGDENGTNDDYPVIPIRWLSLALKSKQVSGPGLTSGLWSYAYSGGLGSFQNPPGQTHPICQEVDCLDPVCLSDSCAGSRSITITSPDASWKRYVHGNTYRYNEGKLLRTEIGTGASSVLTTTTNAYNYAQSGQPFSARIGTSPQPRGAGFEAEYPRPLVQSTTVQQGISFDWSVDTGCTSSGIHCFDALIRPTRVTKSSTLSGSPSKTEVTAYHDNLSKWILGQPASLTVDGIVASQTDYDATYALPIRFYSFTLRKQTLAYDTTSSLTSGQRGTVKTVVDGSNNTTTLGSWYRGIPRTITYADGTSQSAVVNASGWITRITDENGFATNYAYDPMGRLSQITYPANDSVAWAPTTLTFAKATGTPPYGLPAGHWQHTVATGSGRKITYLDALWRPLLVREYEMGVSGSNRFTKQAFDHEGRVTFASYPSTSGTPTTGTWTEYDALGRMTSVTQDSELPPPLNILTTQTAYLSGFRTRVTSPKGQQTLTSYLAWDRPTTDYPVAITHPQGAYTDITRDVFGKPTALTRRNSTGSTSLTRRYLYGGAERLCIVTEPETGSTVYGFNGADLLVNTAAGLTLPSGISCRDAKTQAWASGRRVDRTYDARNRIKTLAFPDGQGNTTYAYTPDGLLSQITADRGLGSQPIVTTAYTYNKRRLPTGEALAVGSHQWGIGTGYNANGHLNVHTLPGGLTVDYAPNALGQATKAGTYASGATYFPNGALKQFTYGNGLTHTLTQNARGLPDTSCDFVSTCNSSAVLNDGYDYDGHGNVAGISDGRSGNRGNRTMTYDALDRLTKTVATPMFGTATYSYDVLDNLRTVQLTAGTKVRNHTYGYDASHRLTSVTNTAGGGTVASLSYDPQGNLANRNGANYDFNHANQLRTVAGVEGYYYDGHGRRVWARGPRGDAYSVYGQDGVLRFQRDERTGQTIEYVYLGGSLVARLRDPIPLAAPRLEAPDSSTSGSYTVSWSTSAQATKYQLQEQVNGGGWTTIHDAADTSKEFSGKPAGSYGYQVRACSASTCGKWSAVRTVAVQLAPAVAPNLNVPGTGLNGSYTVTWGPVAAADTYQLQERQGGDWTTIHNAAGTRKDLSGKAAGNWSYQVRGCNAVGCGPWSATSTVTVILKPTGAPTLTVPTGDNYTGSYSITWNIVGTATRYELEERLGTGAWSQIHNASTRSTEVTGRTAGTWGYRARACNAAGCAPDYSAVQTVKVILKPTGIPTLTVPTGTNSTGSYTLTWNTDGVATRYELREQLNGGSWNLIHEAGGTSKEISGKTTGTWGYQIRACNVAGCANWSATKTVQVLRPPANPPTGLTAPASNTTGSYSVTWDPVNTATSYQLQQRKNGGGWDTVHNAATASRSFSAQTAGTYDYQVRACNGGGCSNWSATKTTQVSLPLSAPTLQAPSSVSTNEPFTVSWNEVGGATSYELQQNANGNGWSTIQDSAATSMMLQRRPATFQFHVKACNASGCSPYSAPRTVQVLPSTDALPDPEEDA